MPPVSPPDALPDDDLDLVTDHDRERLRSERIMQNNLELDHRFRAKRNRKRGTPEPKVGDFLHVSIARGISQRNRAGLTFVRNKTTKVEVVDLHGDALIARQADEAVVDVRGAELILDDDALIARQSPSADEDLMSSRILISQQETEIARLQAELDQARHTVKKEARKAASADNDVAPTRLIAAKAAAKEFDKAQAKGNTAPVGRFAGPPAPEPAVGSDMTDFIVPDKG